MDKKFVFRVVVIGILFDSVELKQYKIPVQDNDQCNSTRMTILNTVLKYYEVKREYFDYSSKF